MTPNTPSEADTILALELEQKVNERVEAVFRRMLDMYDTQQQFYTLVVLRLVNDRQFVMNLMNQMNQLQRETQFSGMYPQPWRY